MSHGLQPCPRTFIHTIINYSISSHRYKVLQIGASRDTYTDVFSSIIRTESTVQCVQIIWITSHRLFFHVICFSEKARPIQTTPRVSEHETHHRKFLEHSLNVPPRVMRYRTFVELSVIKRDADKKRETTKPQFVPYHVCHSLLRLHSVYT